MKFIITCLFLSIVVVTSCEKRDSRVPECIFALTENKDNQPFRCDTGASVKQYLFQGDYVYVFDPGTCGADMVSPVYNSKCQGIGGLGGLAGNILVNGERFDQKARYIKTVWGN